jgi:hypothetical protein
MADTYTDNTNIIGQLHNTFCTASPDIKVRAQLVLDDIFDNTPPPQDSSFHKPHLVGDLIFSSSPYIPFHTLFVSCYQTPNPVERGKAVSLFSTRINDVVSLLSELIQELTKHENQLSQQLVPADENSSDYPRAVRIYKCLNFLKWMVIFPKCRRKMHRNKSMPNVIKMCISLRAQHTNFFCIPKIAIVIAWGVVSFHDFTISRGT